MKPVDLPHSMYVTYIQRREQDLSNLQKSYELKDVTQFNKIGHQILGHAASYGFKDLENIALKMNDLILEDLNVTGLTILEELDMWISQQKAVYDLPQNKNGAT